MMSDEMYKLGMELHNRDIECQKLRTELETKNKEIQRLLELMAKKDEAMRHMGCCLG